MARRLVQFWAGGRAKKKTKKARGGRMPKTMPMPVAEMSPMEGRLDTGVVAPKPRARRRMPAIGGMMGPLR